MDSELKRSSSCERGIALPIAVFALVVIGGLVVLSALYGRQEQQLGRSAIKREHAGAAAQEGVVAQLPVWQASGYNRLLLGVVPPSAGGPAMVPVGIGALYDD